MRSAEPTIDSWSAAKRTADAGAVAGSSRKVPRAELDRDAQAIVVAAVFGNEGAIGIVEVEMAGELVGGRVARKTPVVAALAVSEEADRHRSNLSGRCRGLGSVVAKPLARAVPPQRVVPGKARLIDGHAEELGPLVLCQQLSAAHDALRSVRLRAGRRGVSLFTPEPTAIGWLHRTIAERISPKFAMTARWGCA